MNDQSPVSALIHRLDRLLRLLEEHLPPLSQPVDWLCTAYRWRYRHGKPRLEGIAKPSTVSLDDLLGIDRQKSAVSRNTELFLAGKPANNILLWGSRGTGKSSLIKALLPAYGQAGLRLVEVEKQHLLDLPDLLAMLEQRAERFVVFCDDLSFEFDDSSYKALKVALDGSLAAPADNVLIYATSNRRQLMPEYMSENRQARIVEGELQLGDASEEKLSLAERFGIRLSFHPFDQQQYLAAVEHWLRHFGDNNRGFEPEALRWALHRASRSGRSAWQFAKYWVGDRT